MRIMKSCITFLFLLGGLLFLGFFLYLNFYSYEAVTESIARFINKANRISEIRTQYFTPSRIQLLKIVLPFLALFLFFCAWWSHRKMNRFYERTHNVLRFYKNQFHSFRMALVTLSLSEKLIFYGAFLLFACFGLYNLITRPISCDESGTHILCSSQSILISITRYSANNHPLNSLLMKMAFYLPFKPTTALRLPVYITGLLSFFLLFASARALFGNRAGLLAVVLYCFSYSVTIYAFQARGYGYILFFTLLMFYSSIKIILFNQSKYWLLLSLAAALGFYAVLSFLYAYIPLMTCMLLWFFRQKNFMQLKRLILSGLCTFFIAVLLYTPFFVFSGFQEVFNNQFVKSKSFLQVLQLFPEHAKTSFNFLLGTGHAEINRESYTGYAGLIIFLAIAATLLFITLRHKHTHFRFVCIMAFSYFILSPLFVFLQRVIPYERTWIHFMPLLVLCVVCCAQALSDFLKRPVVLLVFGGIYISLMVYNFNTRYLLWYNRDYQALQLSEFVLKQGLPVYTIYTNEMIVASTLEYEFINKKQAYKFKYAYLAGEDVAPEAGVYNFILWDKRYKGKVPPPDKTQQILENDFAILYRANAMP